MSTKPEPLPFSVALCVLEGAFAAHREAAAAHEEVLRRIAPALKTSLVSALLHELDMAAARERATRQNVEEAMRDAREAYEARRG